MTGSYATIDSPVGRLLLTADAEGLTGLYMHGQRHERAIQPDWIHDRHAFIDATEQLTAYFEGRLTSFDLPLSARGTAFQESVWRAISDIPFGCTATYGELADGIGRPGAARAVGMATGHNPIGIVVPCHRVIGSSGKLTGYAGGLDRKRALLAHESRTRLDLTDAPDIVGLRVANSDPLDHTARRYIRTESGTKTNKIAMLHPID